MGCDDKTPGNVFYLAEYRPLPVPGISFFVMVNSVLRLKKCLDHKLIFKYIASTSIFSDNWAFLPQQKKAIRAHIASCKYCNNLFYKFMDELNSTLDNTDKVRLAVLGFLGVVKEVYERQAKTTGTKPALTVVK